MVVKVILGSTRPNRFGKQVADWIMKLTQESKQDVRFELVDLKEINLPFLDEPRPPIEGNYQQPHAKEWAKIIDEADGFIVVTAEYNFSIPAALKNAMDFLAAEWRHKPITFVSYGASAGGARAVEHLRSSVANVGMFDLREQVVIPNYWEQLDEASTFQPSQAQTAQAQKLIERIAFWSKYLQPARKQLTEA